MKASSHMVIQSHPDLTKSWLWQRLPVDRRSRNQQLVERLKARFASQDTLRILDLGAGSGGQFSFLSPQLNKQQRWLLLDQDRSLLDALPHTIQRIGELSETAEADQEVREWWQAILTGTIQVESICHDMFSIADGLLPGNFDLITANAVFDLHTPTQFRHIIETLLEAPFKVSPSFYFSMHLSGGLSWEPLHELDQIAKDLYQQHMQRQIGPETAMGAHSSQVMAKILEDLGLHLEVKPSNWVIAPTETGFLTQNLDFMSRALSEMGKPLDEWFLTRKGQIQNQVLSMTIEHEDILSY